MHNDCDLAVERVVVQPFKAHVGRRVSAHAEATYVNYVLQSDSIGALAARFPDVANVIRLMRCSSPAVSKQALHQQKRVLDRQNFRARFFSMQNTTTTEIVEHHDLDGMRSKLDLYDDGDQLGLPFKEDVVAMVANGARAECANSGLGCFMVGLGRYANNAEQATIQSTLRALFHGNRPVQQGWGDVSLPAVEALLSQAVIYDKASVRGLPVSCAGSGRISTRDNTFVAVRHTYIHANLL